MKRHLMIGFTLLACVFRASGDPTAFTSDFPISESDVPKGKPAISRVVATFRNNVALCAVAPAAGALQERLAEITITQQAESLLPAVTLDGLDATQAGKIVQELVGKNPALLAELVAIALKEVGADDSLARESIIQAALAGLSGPQQDLKAVAQVLALLAGDPDADSNAEALIAAKKTLVKNGVLPADSMALEEMLLSMKVLEITEAPGSVDNGNSFGSGDQGAGNVGSAPLGGGSGGGGSGGGGGGGSSGSGGSGGGSSGGGSPFGGQALPSQPAPVS